jgi:outer membrane lipoprotein-sorting protein
MSYLAYFFISLFLASGLLGNPQLPDRKPKPTATSTTVRANKNNNKAQVKDINKIIDAIQKQYNSTHSASFEFKQSYKHPFLAATEESEGSVFYKRIGGKMVWSYTKPDNKQKKFFINGKKLTYYSVPDNVAYEHNCYDQDTLSASVAFLLGRGNLKASFDISAFLGDLPNPSLTWLTLVPKENNSPVKKLYLGVNQRSTVIESIVEDPSSGKNHFKFLNFKTNPFPPISSSVFEFHPPKDKRVLIQSMPNVQCPKEVTKKPNETNSIDKNPKKLSNVNSR